MRLAAILLAFALLTLSPVASAAPPCAAEQPDAPAYVVGASVWRETNGIAGLQRGTCEDLDGRTVNADELVARAPPIPQELCVTVPIANLRVCPL